MTKTNKRLQLVENAIENILFSDFNLTELSNLSNTLTETTELAQSLLIENACETVSYAATFWAFLLNKDKLLTVLIGSNIIKILYLFFNDIQITDATYKLLILVAIPLTTNVIFLCYLKRQMKAIENEQNKKFLNKQMRRKVNRRQNNRRNHDNQIITIDQSESAKKTSNLNQSPIRTKEQSNSSQAVACCPKDQQVQQDQLGPEYFFRACRDGQKEIVRQLLSDHGHQLDIQQVEPDTGYTAFHLACAGGHLSVVQQLMKAFGNETCRHLLTNEGKSGLVLAAEYERIEIVQTILSTYKKNEMR
jgi:hypothetical protein